MIIHIDHKKEARTVKRMSWQTKFKLDLIKRNNQALQKTQQSDPIMAKRKAIADSRFLEITSKHKERLPEIHQFTDLSQHHSFYSSYVPLKSHYPVMDQYCETFPYLRYLDENSRTNEKIQYYIQITNDLKDGRQNGQVTQKWQSCFQKFLPQLNVIDAIECYMELLKYGTRVFKGIYKKRGGNCKKEILFHRICQTEKYFLQDPKIRKELNVSVETGEQINQVSLAKTSKTLLCSICLLYDCGLHKVDDNVIDKNYQYISPKNVWKEDEKIFEAMKIIRFYELSLNKTSQALKQEETTLLNKSCSEDCYLFLNKDKYKGIQFQRIRFLSPVVKSFMKMGIEIFCYDPCQICKLFPPQRQKKMTCALVFLYLVEEYNIRARLEMKFYQNDYEMLLNEKSVETAHILGKTHNVLAKRKNKAVAAHCIRKVKDKSIQIATCYHYFIGEEPLDLNCTSCSCHERGFCLPQCLCSPDCPIMKMGCNCKGDKDQCRNRKCSCFIAKTQCEPGICLHCFDCPKKKTSKKNVCHNSQILRGTHKLIRIGPSTIPGAGLGGFAGEFIEADSLVIVYSGQVIQHQIDIMRELLSRDLSFYNFGSPNGTIDARYMGNKSRFVNHANDGRENIRAVVMFSHGNEVVSFYAERDIDKGDELFFDYDGQGDLEKNFKDKYPFIKKKKK